MDGGWTRGRGYAGQFSRNSMGRDRHSNPRYPWSTPSGSCSLFKQASNSILGSYSFSLTLTPFAFPFVFSFTLSRVLSFSQPLFHSSTLSVFLRLSHIASVFHCLRPSLSRLAPTQIHDRHSEISTVAITTWISLVLQAVTAQSFHCNYLLVSTTRRSTLT